MNRTRVVFFIVVAICLAILAYALAGWALQDNTLLQVYIAATVFAGGVILIDFAGLLDHDAGPAGHDFGTLGGHGGEHGAAPTSGHDLGDNSGVASTHAGTGPEHAAGGNGHVAAHPALDQQHPAQLNAAPILSVLVYLRLCVYFCLGFGPVGWVALGTGRTALASLAFAILAGAGTVFLARTFFSFQRKDTGAVLPEAELVGERAIVLVPLSDRVMGKVRVEAGMTVEELYARAADPGRAFERGASVRIVRVTDECVQVR